MHSTASSALKKNRPLASSALCSRPCRGTTRRALFVAPASSRLFFRVRILPAASGLLRLFLRRLRRRILARRRRPLQHSLLLLVVALRRLLCVFLVALVLLPPS